MAETKELDFNISRGLSTELFIDGKLNDQIIVEEGCWYLCTDTAELFLGLADGELKRINEVTDLGTGAVDPAVLEALNTEINTIKTNYATKAFVQEEIGKISIPDDYLTEEDLSDYAKTSDIPDDYLTDGDLSGKGFLTAQDISGKAEKVHEHTLADITDYTAPDFTGYATQEFVTQEIAKAELGDKEVNLDAYYTKSEVDALIPTDYLKEIPTEYITETELNAKGYLTEHQSLANYALKSEIPTDYLKAVPAEYVTETELSGKGFLVASALNDYAKTASIPTKTSQLTNDSGYITAADVTIPSLDNYALKTDLDSKADINHIHTGYAASNHDHNSVYAPVDHSHEEYLTSDDLNGYAKTTDLFSGSYNDLEDKPAIPSIEGLAATSYVDTKVASIVVPTQVSAFTNDANYATEQFVTDAIADYESEHEAVKAVTTTLETTVLPVVEKVETEIAPIVPVVEELVVAKANDVPFTESKIVVNSIGGFVAGVTDVKGLTVAQLFAKLLGFTIDSGDEPDVPEEPEIPEEFSSIAEKIEKTEQSMYSVSTDGTLLVVPFKLVERDAVPTESGFYVVKDSEGNIIDAGYQDLQINDEGMYYIIALPREIDYNTMIDVQTYDRDEAVWVDADISLTSDPEIVAACCDEVGVDISHIDTELYTIWVQEDLCTGSIIRYKIIEER